MKKMNRFSSPWIERGVFYGFLAAFVLSIWGHAYLFNFDGFIHAANARLIVDLLTGQCALTQKIFMFNPVLVPNWTGHALMALAIFSGTSVVVAEKIVVSLCLVLPALGLRQLVGLQKKNLFISWIGLGLCLNQLITLNGVYNFTLGMGVFLWAVFYYLKYGGSERKKAFCGIFAMLLLLAWFSHILTFLFMGVVVLMHELKMLELNNSRPVKILPFIWARFRHRWPVLLAFIPALILTGIYLSHSFQVYNFYDQSPGDNTAFSRLLTTLMLSYFLPVEPTRHTQAVLFLYALCGLAFLGLFIGNFRQARKDHVFFTLTFSACIFWFLSVVLNASLKGGWMMSPRLAMAGWYCFFPLLAAFDWRWRSKTVLLGIALSLIGFNLVYYNVKSAKVETFLDAALQPAPDVEENSLLFSLVYTRGGQFPLSFNGPVSHDIAALRSAGNRIAAEKSCVVDLNNYEAALDYFPLRFKNPYTLRPLWGVPLYSNEVNAHIDTIDLNGFDLEEYRRQTGLAPDYIFIWGNARLLEKLTPVSYGVARRYNETYLPVLEQRLRQLEDERHYSPVYRYAKPPWGDWLRVLKKDYNK